MNLTDMFWLPRAGRFSSYYDANAKLPIVYGDPGLGPPGYAPTPLLERWELPCINQFVTSSSTPMYGKDYCYCIGEQISDLSSRTIVYKNHQYVAPVNYSIVSSHYEAGDLHITYISFATNFPNITEGEIVTAIGMGAKETTGSTGATSYCFGLPQIIKHFLTKINTFTTSIIDDVSYSQAINNSTNIFAFGVIKEDDTYWNIIHKLIGAGAGKIHLNNNNRLVFDLDSTNLTPSKYETIIPKAEIEFKNAKQKEINLINQCPVSYDYNHIDYQFMRYLNESSMADKMSQNIYGVKEPATPYQLYWVPSAVYSRRIQEMIVKKYKDPHWEIEAEDQTLKRCNLDPGDVIITSFDELYQKDGLPHTNRAYEVLGVNPDFLTGKNNLRLRDMEYNLTTSFSLTTSTSYDKTKY